MSINIVEREMTGAEYGRTLAGFDELALEFGVTPTPEVRYGYVVVDNDQFAGCISGLQHHSWFYLTDLWLEKAYRKQGLGAELLKTLETRLVSLGVQNVYLWTAGYEAAPFYQKQGYSIFAELENYFPAGYSRIGLRKTLQPA